VQHRCAAASAAWVEAFGNAKLLLVAAANVPGITDGMMYLDGSPVPGTAKPTRVEGHGTVLGVVPELDHAHVRLAVADIDPPGGYRRLAPVEHAERRETVAIRRCELVAADPLAGAPLLAAVGGGHDDAVRANHRGRPRSRVGEQVADRPLPDPRRHCPR